MRIVSHKNEIEKNKTEKGTTMIMNLLTYIIIKWRSRRKFAQVEIKRLSNIVIY